MNLNIMMRLQNQKNRRQFKRKFLKSGLVVDKQCLIKPNRLIASKGKISRAIYLISAHWGVGWWKNNIFQSVLRFNNWLEDFAAKFLQQPLNSFCNNLQQIGWEDNAFLPSIGEDIVAAFPVFMRRWCLHVQCLRQRSAKIHMKTFNLILRYGFYEWCV